ncbi:hypothetical protein [Clostridium vincentii]|uniref:Uncharacterized protein n=1 Tax=Clostridium vincentii TaxID=52704 RepID=A0A2T0BF21_9CLOT|nr:hypothetical protein [Clostridium vincentii]PRR82506.1 hypothetical protein CLVI_16410 [Clostridium vincentii]
MKKIFKNLRVPIAINMMFLIIFIFLKNDNFTYIFLVKFFLMSSINFIILVRIKDSYSILNRIKKLEKLDFPKYKDITVILIAGVMLFGTYLSLFLDYFGVVSIFQHLREVDIDIFYKTLLVISLIVLVMFAFSSNISGIIIRPYFSNGVEIFEIKEHNVMYGNEILNRATGSFKNGIIIGYYIFNFKDIKEKYKDNFGNIIIYGYQNHPFKIVISASRSNAYFYDVLNIY